MKNALKYQKTTWSFNKNTYNFGASDFSEHNVIMLKYENIDRKP